MAMILQLLQARWHTIFIKNERTFLKTEVVEWQGLITKLTSELTEWRIEDVSTQETLS